MPAEYTVVHEVSVAKIPKDAPLESVCLLGCGEGVLNLPPLLLPLLPLLLPPRLPWCCLLGCLLGCGERQPEPLPAAWASAAVITAAASTAAAAPPLHTRI